VTEHKVGTREEWLAARIELLDHEKELTRRSDELASRTSSPSARAKETAPARRTYPACGNTSGTCI
jgi:predicted dithiol-disulfide oxidoreductase (DUF899 family)